MAYACIKRGSSGEGYFALSKENPPFFISHKQFEAWHLQEGMQLSQEEYLHLKSLHDSASCMEKAMQYLAVREHTRLELRQKLSLKQFSNETINAVLDSLSGSGAQSDERYAEIMVRSRQRRNPEGKALLVKRLQAKGVSSQVAREAVESAFLEHGGEYLQDAWERAWRQTPDKEKCVRKLVAKGFSYGEVRHLL